MSYLCENVKRKESQSTQKHALATHRSHAEVGQSHGGLKKGDPTERQGVLGSLFAASSNWGGVRLPNKVLPLFGKKSTRFNLVTDEQLKRSYLHFFPDEPECNAEIFKTNAKHVLEQISMADVQAYFMKYQNAEDALENTSQLTKSDSNYKVFSSVKQYA